MSYNHNLPEIDGMSSISKSPLWQRLLEQAPYFPRCAPSKKALKKGCIYTKPARYAAKYAYMQVNRKDMFSWLVFDLDDTSEMIWEEVGLPAPNIVVYNKQACKEPMKAHLYYAIVPVCKSDKARTKPVRYMNAVREAMSLKLSADPCYHGPFAKTPYHDKWLTREIHYHEYSLGELAEHLELNVKPQWSEAPNIDAVAHSRNCTLFEETRHYAYSIVNHERQQGSYSDFNRLVKTFANSRNNFKQRGFHSNLTTAEVNSVVKSVTNWTWEKYTGNSRCHLGVMQLDKSLSISDRQRLAAQRTHKKRTDRTKSKIRAAIKTLLNRGTKLTYVAIAKLTGIARQTIAKYKHLLQEVQPPKIVPLADLLTQTINVKNATHQVTSSITNISVDTQHSITIQSLIDKSVINSFDSG